MDRCSRRQYSTHVCADHSNAGLYQNLLSPRAVLDQRTDTGAVEQLQLAKTPNPANF